jgi:putative transcriptional regulator
MKRETYDELLTSVEQGGTILRGEKAPNRSFRFDNPNVLAIRRHLGLTQQKFAGLLGISLATLRNWEQGRRKLEGAARVLLCVAARYPRAVLDTVHM